LRTSCLHRRAALDDSRRENTWNRLEPFTRAATTGGPRRSHPRRDHGRARSGGLVAPI